MLAELRAESDIRGRRVNLSLAWAAAPPRSRLRLVRRLVTYPSDAYVGVGVFDLAEGGSLAGQPSLAKALP